MRISDWSSDVCSSDLALVGLALSGVAAVAMTYLSEEIHPQHLGLAMGLYIGGNAIGGMSGRLLSGVLVDYLSWHSVLGVMGGLALLAALLLWRFLPESRHFHPRPLRLRGLLQGYRSEEHTSELQTIMRNAYAVFCLKKKKIIVK